MFARLGGLADEVKEEWANESAPTQADRYCLAIRSSRQLDSDCVIDCVIHQQVAGC